MNINRVTHWLKHLSLFAFFQAAIQVIGMVSGLILVRFLSLEEYSLYTIAFSMQSTFNILANLGIGSAIMSIAGRILNDSRQLGQLLYTGFYYRRLFATAAMLVVTPAMIWLLLKNGAGLSYTVFLTFLILLDLNLNLVVEYYLVVLRLLEKVITIQKIELETRFLRLIMIVGSYFFVINAFVAVLTTLLTSFIRRIMLAREISKKIKIEGPLNEQYQKEIISTSKHLAPNAIFYTLQGQLSIWLLSIFGNAQGVAEIGALGRFAVILRFFGEITTNYIAPAFARIQQKQLFVRRLAQLCFFSIILSSGIVYLTYLFPEKILWIIGKQYCHLEKELCLILFSSIMHSFGGMLWSIMLSRAWVRHVWLNIPAILFLQTIFVIFGDISTITGAIWIGTLSAVPGIVISLFSLTRGIENLENEVGQPD